VKEESEMNATTVAADLAKNVFELLVPMETDGSLDVLHKFVSVLTLPSECGSNEAPLDGIASQTRAP
jgi:hypothetical protein